MTVNELIGVLMGVGDDKFRSRATVRVVNDSPCCVDYDTTCNGSWEFDIPDRFDIKDGINSVDIHVN